MSLRSIYLSCALLALSAVPGFCSPVLFADRTSWLGAVTSPTTLTFENAVGNYSTAAGYTTGLGMPDSPTFVGSDVVNGIAGYNLYINDNNASQYYNFGSGDSLWWAAFNGLTTSSVLHITWPTPVTAVAVDFMTYSGSNLTYSAKINNDPAQVYTSGPTPGWPGHTFFGLTSATPINSIDFFLPVGSTATPLIDNFSYSLSDAAPTDPGDTPEGSTLLLISSGLIGMALVGRRMRRSDYA